MDPGLPYFIAYLALLAFPFFTSYLFRTRSRSTATAVAVIMGTLFLPEQVAFDLPAVPTLGKDNIIFLSVLIAAFRYHRSALKMARPGRGPEILILVLIVASVGTLWMNREPLLDEGRLEDGLSAYWFVANAADDLLVFALPFVLGRAMFRDFDDLYVLLRTLTSITFYYTGLIALEVLLSIPFRSWFISPYVYGISAVPSFRWGGVQPVVFMQHALELATIMASGAVAVAALARARKPATRFGIGLSRITILSGLMMTRNVAGNVYGFTLTFAFWLLKPRNVVRVALLLSFLTISYPTLRMLDLFPADYLVETAAQFDADRARSLEGRFDEEDHVLRYIGDRLLFGWGNVVRTPGAETFGVGEVGLDSWWVIWLGSRGLIGVLAIFLLLAIPVFKAWHKAKSLDAEHVLPLLAGIMLIIAIRAIDLLLNGWWNYLPVFLAGALFGVLSEKFRDPGKKRRFNHY